MKKPPSKVADNWPPISFFQYCQPAQNQPKSHILFHKNVSLRGFYILTLLSRLIPCLEFMELACRVLNGHFGPVYLLQVSKIMTKHDAS